jgi:hypothetical protein
MSVRHIAVLVGSHDPTYFAHYSQRDRPSEAAVLTALRAQRSTSEAGHSASAARSPTDRGRRTARRAGARDRALTRRAQAPDPAGPPRLRAFAAARTRRSIRHARARILATRAAGA